MRRGRPVDPRFRAPYREGAQVLAFNGVSIGKGHLAEAKAAINDADKPKSVFQSRESEASVSQCE